MRKLTKNELTRNGMYAEVSKADFGEFKAVGNIKQGFLFKNAEGKSAVVKVILKKDEVDYEEEKLERPTENIEDEPETDEDAEVSENEETGDEEA